MLLPQKSPWGLQCGVVIVLALDVQRGRLDGVRNRGQLVLHFIDQDAARFNLIGGYASSETAAELIDTFKEKNYTLVFIQETKLHDDRLREVQSTVKRQ